MTEASNQAAKALAQAAQDYSLDQGPEDPQLLTAHIGDDLTLTILVVATLTDMNIHDRLGKSISQVADVIMNESITKEK